MSCEPSPSPSSSVSSSSSCSFPDSEAPSPRSSPSTAASSAFSLSVEPKASQPVASVQESSSIGQNPFLRLSKETVTHIFSSIEDQFELFDLALMCRCFKEAASEAMWSGDIYLPPPDRAQSFLCGVSKKDRRNRIRRFHLLGTKLADWIPLLDEQSFPNLVEIRCDDGRQPLQDLLVLASRLDARIQTLTLAQASFDFSEASLVDVHHVKTLRISYEANHRGPDWFTKYSVICNDDAVFSVTNAFWDLEHLEMNNLVERLTPSCLDEFDKLGLLQTLHLTAMIVDPCKAEDFTHRIGRLNRLSLYIAEHRERKTLSERNVFPVLGALGVFDMPFFKLKELQVGLYGDSDVQALITAIREDRLESIPLIEWNLMWEEDSSLVEELVKVAREHGYEVEQARNDRTTWKAEWFPPTPSISYWDPESSDE